jgi:hypothetical protein
MSASSPLIEIEYLDAVQSIACVRGAFSRTRELVAFCESRPAEWRPSRTLAEASDYLVADQFDVSRDHSDEQLGRWEQELLAAWGQSLVSYCRVNPIKITGHEGTCVLRYRQGGYYKAHSDWRDTGRVVSGVLFLNSDFEGGELTFTRQRLTVRPEPGMVILFPSNYVYMHQAQPVAAGTRYTAVSFFNGV